jgi:hypothetical protein
MHTDSTPRHRANGTVEGVLALQDALDSALPEQEKHRQGLEFDNDDRGSGQVVAGARHGVGLEPATEGENGYLRFGQDALAVMVVGLCGIAESLGAGKRVAAPNTF